MSYFARGTHRPVAVRPAVAITGQGRGLCVSEKDGHCEGGSQVGLFV